MACIKRPLSIYESFFFASYLPTTNHFNFSSLLRYKHLPTPPLLKHKYTAFSPSWDSAMRGGAEEMRSSVMADIEASRPPGNGMVVGGLSPLSETLWRNKADAELVGDVSAWLTWKDLTVTMTLPKGETHRVLMESLTGFAESGTLTALMGPSGSGKSKLLDAIAGHLAANAFLSGVILLNGRKGKLSFRTAAYLTQDDTLIEILTVRETIWYSARLRLSNKMPQEECL
ncbi:hypothetical protein Cni_G25674 [Canna indica]|uniref:ABC transporter domain-containing protein n=1 Tax=Canna indica TaxID=4628 RepID=A0AAQ3L288_9LILI|nr:hypothetical protein Cni_G25674 [Canna indica]